MAREIIHAGLTNERVHRARDDRLRGVPRARSSRTRWSEASGVTGVPAEVIRELAHAYARADRAQICWTLGITEHHNAVDNVLALINLALLTGHVGRYGSGLNPLRGQNNVQGGGDMGAIPNKLPGFQDVEDDRGARAVRAAWGVDDPAEDGLAPDARCSTAMEHGELHALYVIGENPAQSEADRSDARELLEGLDLLVVQDIFLTKTAELADVVLPATARGARPEGTVTNSERRVQRVRKALDPPGEARDDIEIICELARRLGHDWGEPTAEEVWDELRSLAPMHGGMSYARLEAARRHPVAVPDRGPSGHAVPARAAVGGAGRGPAGAVLGRRARAAGRRARRRVPDPADHRPPARLVQHRRADRRLHLAAAPRRVARPVARGRRAARLADGEIVRVVSRRGSIEAPVRLDPSLRPGLAFMTLHFPDEVDATS